MTVLQIFIWLPIFPTLSEDLDHVMCKCTSGCISPVIACGCQANTSHPACVITGISVCNFSSTICCIFARSQKNHQVAKLCGYLMAMSNLQDSLRSYLPVYFYMEQGPI